MSISLEYAARYVVNNIANRTAEELAYSFPGQLVYDKATDMVYRITGTTSTAYTIAGSPGEVRIPLTIANLGAFSVPGKYIFQKGVSFDLPDIINEVADYFELDVEELPGFHTSGDRAYIKQTVRPLNTSDAVSMSAGVSRELRKLSNGAHSINKGWRANGPLTRTFWTDVSAMIASSDSVLTTDVGTFDGKSLQLRTENAQTLSRPALELLGFSNVVYFINLKNWTGSTWDTAELFSTDQRTDDVIGLDTMFKDTNALRVALLGTGQIFESSPITTSSNAVIPKKYDLTVAYGGDNRRLSLTFTLVSSGEL